MDEKTFEPQGITDTALAAGLAAAPRFQRAVTHLERLLAERDDAQYHALTLPSWDAFRSTRIAITPRLHVEIPVPGRDPVSIPVHAHIDGESALACFSDPAAIGRHNLGGRAVSALFEGDDQESVAPWWAVAWDLADDESPVDRLRLIEEQPATDTIAAIHASGVKRLTRPRRDGSRPRSPVPSEAEPPTVTPPPAPPPLRRRRLKNPSSLEITSMELVNPDAPSGTVKTIRRRGLRSTIPAPPPSRSPTTNGRGPKAYDDRDRETRGWKVLAMALSQLDDRELEDYRALRGIGADSLDQLRRAV